MRKFFIILLALFVSMPTLTTCGSKSTQDTVSKALGIDVSGGEEVTNTDSHSGNGDGASCIALHFDTDTVLEEIKNSENWKEFPLDETVRTLVYGVSNSSFSRGPFLNDGNGRPLVPGILNGYYLLIDRHMDRDTDILHRASFNFTLGLYDTDTDTLYFCKLDT